MGGDGLRLAVAGAGVGADVGAHEIDGVNHHIAVGIVESGGLDVLLNSRGDYVFALVNGIWSEAEKEAHLVEILAAAIVGDRALAVEP